MTNSPLQLDASLPPLSLYVHIPWCVRKCPYCDFNSHAAGPEIPEQAYIQRLIADLQQDQPWAQGRKLTSIFFGGGTPSLFSAAGIGQIVSAAEKIIGFNEDIEITLEANPGTFEQEKFSGFRSAGINRLSIGIQSFNDAHLTKLGRIHSGNQALSAIDTARTAGFENFNLDLMHGLSGQSLAEASADIQQAIDLGAKHISWYQLTIEPNTEFYSRPPQLPEDDILADIQQMGMALLDEHGFGQYEVSAFAQPGQRSEHNINYWQFGDYLGIGAGAHGKITCPISSRLFAAIKPASQTIIYREIGNSGPDKTDSQRRAGNGIYDEWSASARGSASQLLSRENRTAQFQLLNSRFENCNPRACWKLITNNSAPRPSATNF